MSHGIAPLIGRRLESALALLGLGDPNQVSWGGMVANGRAALRAAPHPVAVPGAAFAIALLAISLLGDAAGDRLRASRAA